MTPLRLAPEFAATVNVTVPPPWPLDFPVTAMKELLVEAVHGHKPGASTQNENIPPPAGTLMLEGTMVSHTSF